MATKQIAQAIDRQRMDDALDGQSCNQEREQAIQLACLYRERVLDLLTAELGFKRPTTKQMERPEFEQQSVAECELAEALATIIELHLLRQAIRKAKEQAITNALGATK